MWRCCGTKAGRSPWRRPTTGYLRGVPVWLRYWQYGKRQRPWTRPTTHILQWTFISKAVWVKGRIHCKIAFDVVDLFLLFLFNLYSYFLFFFAGGVVVRVEGRQGGVERWRRLWCMTWNSQRINGKEKKSVDDPWTAVPLHYRDARLALQVTIIACRVQSRERSSLTVSFPTVYVTPQFQHGLFTFYN